ncbi:MAG TPA: septal ring lytic transglycosylase RlpA family protein [Alphaproteobacteria bacterium]|nr:septal ring lytic transglycosylase RlpA family protein [Alphaproteobacteria bacterium]
MRSRKPFWAFLGLLLAALLAGCQGGSSSRPEGTAQNPPAKGYYKIGSAYQVQGVWYYPGVDYSYDETGIASWYGPDFHGKYTANGEVYDMNELTAAHPTLPMPSIVRVTNLENGRSIIVRINDRGPYVRGRILDLSRRAAQLLGVDGPGTAKVRVQILADESRQAAFLAQQGEIQPAERIAGSSPTEKVVAQPLAPPPGIAQSSAPPPSKPGPTPSAASIVASAQASPTQAAAPPGAQAGEQQVRIVPVTVTSIYVQVGAFSKYENANKLRAKLASTAPTTISQANVDGQPFFRVRLGPAANVPDADRLLGQMVQAGYHDARIVVE